MPQAKERLWQATQNSYLISYLSLSSATLILRHHQPLIGIFQATDFSPPNDPNQYHLATGFATIMQPAEEVALVVASAVLGDFPGQQRSPPKL